MLGRNAALTFLAFLMYFFTALTFFLFTKSGEEKTTMMIADSVISRLDDGDEDVSTLISAYKDSPIFHIRFYDIGIKTPIADNLTDEYTVDSSYQAEDSSVFMKKDEIIGKDAFVVYRTCRKRSLSIMISKAVSQGYTISFFLITFGSLIVAVLCIAIYIFLYYQFKKSLRPLKLQVSKLHEFVHSENAITYEDDIGYLSFMLRDSRHKLKHQLEETNISNQKMDFILDSFSQGLIVIDASYKIVIINQKALTIFHKNKEETKGKYFDVLEATHDLFVNFSMVIQTNKPISFVVKIEGRVYQCDINPINYAWAKSLLIEEKNGASLLMIDVTDEYNSSEMKKEFFANSSHELKSPLTSILGYLQLIENGTIQGEENIKQAMDKCIKDSQRMNKIVSDMLTLSSLERQALRPIEEIHVSSQIDMILDYMKIQAEEKHIIVTKHYEDLIVKMNPDDFYLVIKNIVENAIRYNNENGKIEIVVSIDERSISIQDTGIGISEQNLSRIFERFFRVDKARSRHEGGTGLGLAIVKHVCNYYDLNIKVESELGKGSIFVIEFPKN